MVSKTFNEVFDIAVQEAKNRRHEYISIEHLLFALLFDSECIEIIEQCGGSVMRVKEAIEKFFTDKIERVPENIKYNLQPTLSCQRVILRAVNQASFAGKKEAALGDILASIFLEQDSHAKFILNSEKITRLDVLNFISHKVSKISPDWQPRDRSKTGTVNKAKPANPLKLFAIDLNERAAKGMIDPLIGRDAEVQRIVQVLCRRRKNNPLFVGEPGVGKTAIVEGLALKIHEGNINDIFKGVCIYALDLGAMIAGTKFRGQFEQRLKGVLSALKKKEKSVLFIDEIHTIVGAGATGSGAMDASNILKPLLSTGEFKCIGSTTYEEFKNNFDKDRALSRRFEKIEVAEPTIEETIDILKGLKSRYEDHHGIIYTDLALKSAAKLSHKFIRDRYLPDKAIDVIDEAGAFIRISGSSRRKKIHDTDIEKIVAKMAKIPTVNVSMSDKNRLKNLEDKLKEVVFGQDAAIKSLTRAIKRSRAGLRNPGKPIGSFLFTGPTGVGKTEIAKQIARLLDVHLLQFDMSEYMEKHAVARLIGAPPGYVGFDQGGLLTEGIRKNPYSVLLLDEIEKAHLDMFNILLQVMDHSTLTDNNGKVADFRNVVIIMTSNAGTKEMGVQAIGFGDQSSRTEDKSQKAVDSLFNPEFRNRLDEIINFKALTVEIMEKVVDKFIAQLNEQILSKKVTLILTPKTRTWLAKKGHNPQYGARPLTRLIQTKIKDAMSERLIFGDIEKNSTIVADIINDKVSLSYQVSDK